MDFHNYHDRDEYPYESRRTSDHDRHRRERRSDDYHHTSARMRNREGQHSHQDEFDMPASQPEKADYVQSWLQRSQANRARPPEPIPEDRPRKISPRVHMVKQASQKKKRTRSESPEPAHPRQTHSPVVIRFEKRSRHKTRHDKYDYKPEGDRNKRQAKSKEHRREDSYGSLEDVQRHKRSGYQHVSQQRSNDHAQRTDHGPSRHRSSKAKEIEALPRRPDHKSRAAEPRSRSRKQQAEDKELEELSAFFTRRADGERAEVEKIRHRTRREQRHDTAAARHPASNVRQQRTHDSPTTSLHPSRSIGSTRQPSPGSLRPDTRVSSCGDDPRNILPTRPSSRSTTYFTWSISDRDPNARAPVSNDSTSERPQRSIQSSARKAVLREQKIKSPDVVLGDLKIRPTSRAKYRPRKPVVYKDAQVQTSFDAETDRNRQHAKKPIPQYRDSAVMTADDNSNLKERVSMLAVESLTDMNKRPVDEQHPSDATAARQIGAPPQPYSQPQPQPWVTYNAEDRLVSQPFIAARSLPAQGVWQTYQGPSSGQEVGRYVPLLPPSRIQAVMPSHRLTPLRPAADNISGLSSYPSTQSLHVPTQGPPRESMEDYINRIEQEALQNSTNNEEMDELQPHGPDLTESTHQQQQQLGPGLYPEGNGMLLPDNAWYDQHPLATDIAHIEAQDRESFDLEYYGQSTGAQDTRLPRMWEDPRGF